ncbi:hypothetical protein [Prevotella sp.]|nr:hypothetical protein [Prevotella sp.]
MEKLHVLKKCLYLCKDMKYDCFLMMAMVRILKENFKANDNQI